VGHNRKGLYIFADLFEFEAVLLDTDVQPFVRHAVAEEEFDSFECRLVVLLSIDSQTAKFDLRSNSRLRWYDFQNSSPS
jgi:hypothetical protein